MCVSVNPSWAAASTYQPVDSLCFDTGAGWCSGGLLGSPWWVQILCPHPRPFHLSDATLARGAMWQSPSCVLGCVHRVLQSPAQMLPALESLLGVAHLELSSPTCCPGNGSTIERFQHLRRNAIPFSYHPSPPSAGAQP